MIHRRHWQVLDRCGRAGLIYLLIGTLVFSPAIFSPRMVFAAFEDQSSARLPAQSATTYRFAIGDVDGVNGDDIIVATAGQPQLFLNDGKGVFSSATLQLPTFAGTERFLGVALGDVTGNAALDVILANSAGANVLLINDGAGNFSNGSATRLPANASVSTDVALAHLNQDLMLDIIVANRGSQNRIWINDGTGYFSDETTSRLAPDSDPTQAIAVADVNNDGSFDVFFANDGRQNRLHVNDGLGVLSDVTATALPNAVDESLDAAFGDVDANGYTDLLLANSAAGAALWLNTGGVFAPAPAGALLPSSDYPIAVRLGDVNEDRHLDVFLATAGQNRVWFGDGSGNFSDATSELPVDDGRSFAVALGDVDADFDLDVLEGMPLPPGGNKLLINDIPFPRIRIDIEPKDFIEVGSTVTIAVEVFDEDGVATTTLEVNGSPVALVGGVGTFVPTTDGLHTAVVTAEDTLGNVGTRSATFDVEPPDLTGPTVNLSIEPPQVLLGESVTIQASATDDESGVDSLAVTVSGAPVALDTNGTAVYQTQATGAHPVVATATDLAGNSSISNGSFDVLPDTVFPVVSLSATPDPVDLTHPIRIDVSATDNVDVTSLTLTVRGPGITGEQDVPLDTNGQGSFIPYIPGTFTLTARATDPSGNETVETLDFEAVGTPDTETPQVVVTGDRASVALGNTVTLSVSATDNVLVQSTALEVNGNPVTLDSNGEAVVTGLVLGPHTAVGTATDPSGNVGSDSFTYQVVDPATDTSPPVVALAAPSEGSDLSGLVDLTGTADDETLTQYTLAYAPAGSDNFATFKTGLAPVTNGILGTLDTTTLANGMYDIRLQASDVNDLTSTVQQTYMVSGEFKASIYSVSMTDLVVPVSGIEIRVIRTYDSRNRGIEGDFGFGWSLEVLQRGTYTNNRQPGDGWVILSGGGLLNPPCSISSEQKFHRTEVRFSDTEFYQFAFQVNMFGFGSAIAGGCTGNVEFIQVGGVPGATLEIIGSNAVFWPNGNDYLTYDLGDPLFGTVYEPQDVRLTTLDGRVFDLNLTNGLERIGDANGNSIFRPRSWDRPLYAFRGGFKGAGASSTDSKIAANIERGF